MAGIPQFGLGGVVGGTEVGNYEVGGHIIGSPTRSLSDVALPDVPDVVIVNTSTTVFTSSGTVALRLPPPIQNQARSCTVRFRNKFGVLLFTKTVTSDRPFRLPKSLQRETALSVEFVGNVDVRQFDAARSVSQLNGR